MKAILGCGSVVVFSGMGNPGLELQSSKWGGKEEGEWREMEGRKQREERLRHGGNCDSKPKGSGAGDSFSSFSLY